MHVVSKQREVSNYRRFNNVSGQSPIETIKVRIHYLSRQTTVSCHQNFTCLGPVHRRRRAGSDLAGWLSVFEPWCPDAAKTDPLVWITKPVSNAGMDVDCGWFCKTHINAPKPVHCAMLASGFLMASRAGLSHASPGIVSRTAEYACAGVSCSSSSGSFSLSATSLHSRS